MSEINWEQIETILDQALDLPEDQRKEFIEKKCTGKPKLKGEVTQLLDSIFDSEGWLENPEEYKRDIYEEMADDVKLLSSEKSLVGTQVGSYLIEEKIGEGGMGSVYLAKHSNHDIKHNVAIKIIRSGKATSENIKRFKREQQILAGLHHPGIARMYDAGTTGDGFPYIIMEYVDGISITNYCIKEKYTLEQKLELFTDVLQAIRHAHESLVIHRDLKPENILVNESGEIKILDFGISKLLEDDEDHSLTKTGDRLLTPRYAAPEQVLQENITTAADLYALGIVFYQLIADYHPFDFEDLSRYEIEQAILKQEAHKPSTKVSDPKVKKQLQGDLDAIALKAIRKEPKHRYRMANEFLEDLKNYQKGIPVTAHEDSFRYRSQKFFKRHKQEITVAAGVLLLLIGLTGFYTWQIAQERNQAQIQAQRAEQVKEFMLGIFDETNPELAKNLDKDLSASQLLKSGIDKVEQELQDQPRIYIEMLSSISRALMNLDDYKNSNKALHKALRENQKTINNKVISASLFTVLAELKLYQGKIDSANFFATEARKNLSTQESDQTLALNRAEANNIYALTKAFQGKYDSSISYYLKADSLYQRAGHKGSIKYISNLKGLGETYNYKGNYKQSEKYLQRTLEGYKEIYSGQHLNILNTKSQLGNLYYQMGKHDKAQKIFSKVLQETKDILGETNIEIAVTLNRAAANYIALAKYDSAIAYSKDALTIYDKIYEEESNTRILSSLNNLALAKNLKGKTSEAIQIYRDIIAKKEKKYGKNHTSIAASIYNLAMALQSKKLYDEAYSLMQRVLKIDKKSLGENHPYIALDYIKLGSLQRNLKLYESARQSLQQAKSIIDSQLHKDHKRAGTYYYHLGLLNKEQNNESQAKENFQKALDIYKINYNAKHPDILKVEDEIKNIDS